MIKIGYISLLTRVLILVSMVCSGIDAPESAMPYGKEAKEALLKMVEGKPLTVHVYDTDRYGRSVGDIHCNGVFVQVRN